MAWDVWSGGAVTGSWGVVSSGHARLRPRAADPHSSPVHPPKSLRQDQWGQSSQQVQVHVGPAWDTQLAAE